MADHRRNAKPQTIRTLLVNDSPQMLKLLSQILASEQGFVVVGSATDGCQALRHVSALRPELVLMGLHLSKISSVQAINHIKSSNKPPIVFMISTDDTPSSRMMAETAAVDAWVASRLNLEVSLRSKLQEWFSLKAQRAHERSRTRKRLRTLRLPGQAGKGWHDCVDNYLCPVGCVSS